RAPTGRTWDPPWARDELATVTKLPDGLVWHGATDGLEPPGPGRRPRRPAPPPPRPAPAPTWPADEPFGAPEGHGWVGPAAAPVARHRPAEREPFSDWGGPAADPVHQDPSGWAVEQPGTW